MPEEGLTVLTANEYEKLPSIRDRLDRYQPVDVDGKRFYVPQGTVVRQLALIRKGELT